MHLIFIFQFCKMVWKDLEPIFSYYFDWIYMTNSYLIYYPLYNFSKIKLYSARDINHMTNNTCTKIINGTLFFTLPSHWILNTLLFAFPFKIAIWIDFAHIMLRCYIIWTSFSIFLLLFDLKRHYELYFQMLALKLHAKMQVPQFYKR